MSQETKPVSFTTGGHPDEVQLLLALERELPPEDLNRVEQHLGNCWSCRARFDEMQRGILAFVEYREQRYLPSLPAPPGASRDFRDRLRNVLHEGSPIGLPTRVWRRLTGLLTLPRQVKWVSAVALMMAIIIFWVHVLVNPRTVSANELLSRAVAAQNPPASAAKTNRRRIAHQKMQIRSGKQTVIRNFEWKVGDSIQHARWETRPDPLAWNAPMTAEGFGDWRNSLLEKIDKVKRSGDRLTLDTTTDKNLIKEAWIVVRADDFHPLEQHLRFSDDQQLDFIELAFQIGDEPQLAPQSVSQAVAPPKPSRPAVPPPQVNLDEAELQLRYILFTRQWDLGEDLVIGRSPNMVTLSGTVSSKEREEAMRAALSTLPEIQLSIELPVVPGTRISTANRAVVTKPSALSSPPLLKDVLEQTFTSREERLAFVDRCLADSDLALSHAWALKGLVDKYSEAEEQRLKPESDAKLREMLRVHLRELGLANEGLRPLLELLPASDGAPPVLPSNWRPGIIALFNAVQQQDRLVARLVVGSQTDEQNIATASAEFESAHQAIRLLLAGLRDFAGDPAAK
jgi:anti-sigma factor RsiW